LALVKRTEWGMETEEAIMAALTSLNSGGVAAEFHAVRMTNEASGNTWSVPSLHPVHIELMTQGDPQLGDGE